MIDNIYIETIENEIDLLLTILKPECNKDLFYGIEYALKSGGKRVRPTLMLISAEVNGVNEREITRLALALELIHTYSLIHDDLPSMDNDDIRRGKPTLHKVIGEDMAILTGDALLNLAMEIMFKLVEKSPEYIKACAFLARNSGIRGMIGGQAIDIRLNKSNATEEKIIQMSALKTSRLIESALVCPCLVTGDSERIEDFAKIGKNIGQAFQIVDDMLDKGEEKITYLSILSFQECRHLLFTLEEESKKILQKYSKKADILIEYLHKLTNRLY